MIFWDTSAVMPLLVKEEETGRVVQLARSESSLVVWWGTVVECLSALARVEREGTLSPRSVDDARTLLHELRAAWSEVQPTEEVRSIAARLLKRHALKAADVLQLAAALVCARGSPEAHLVACLDHRLNEAAAREGFQLAFRIGG